MNEERKLRIAQLASMKKHLAELSLLTGREVAREELLPLNRTLEIQDLLRSNRREINHEFEVPFSELATARFNNYLNHLAKSVSLPAYLWTHLSYTCGLLELQSLTQIKCDFDFDGIPSGIFTLVTNDLRERVTFDWFEEDQRRLV